jgi:hypothetical protein
MTIKPKILDYIEHMDERKVWAALLIFAGIVDYLVYCWLIKPLLLLGGE